MKYRNRWSNFPEGRNALQITSLHGWLILHFVLRTCSISKESIIDIHVKIVPVANKIESCTEQTLELSVLKIYLVSAAKTQLPLQIEDASRPEKSDVSIRVTAN